VATFQSDPTGIDAEGSFGPTSLVLVGLWTLSAVSAGDNDEKT
jgi:hypothetical protein